MDIVVTSAAGLIGLVTGGRSGERDNSLLSAGAVGEAFGRQSLKYVRLDPLDEGFADRILAVDVAFLAIAGRWAEDGKLQGLLDSLGVSYTGSGVLASAAAMHKPMAKALVSAAGVRILPHILICSSRWPIPRAAGPTSSKDHSKTRLVSSPAPASASLSIRAWP